MPAYIGTDASLHSRSVPPILWLHAYGRSPTSMTNRYCFAYCIVAAASAALPAPLRYIPISASPPKIKRMIAHSVISVENTNLNLNVWRTPSVSPLPKNCAPNIPAPDIAPNTQRLKTNISWFTTDTPLICMVPRRPIMMLSSILTNVVIPVCTIMGIISENIRR